MNSQLTQALSDSVKREEMLKKQCDQLLESLHSALGEDEKLALRIAQMEENTEYLQSVIKNKEDQLSDLKSLTETMTSKHGSKGKMSELAKLIENNIEEGGAK